MGVEKQDIQQAITYYKKACFDLNYGGGCTTLGNLYNYGKKVAEDIQQAKNYYEKACSLNDFDGCYNLGMLYAEERDYQQAKIYHDKACFDLNDGKGCAKLGGLYYIGDGRPFVRLDIRQSITYYEKSCSLNYALSCQILGHIYIKGYSGARPDYKRAITYYEKACNLNYVDSCLKLGEMYIKGVSVSRNNEVAKEYFGKACDINNGVGCTKYRELIEQGY
jgi:hypothetical protein